MTNKELLYIITVADEGSISKAAKKLYIAQPSLSQAVQKLEHELNTKLFMRSTKGLKLTYAGECYYKTAKQILKIYDDMIVEINDIHQLKSGHIHIGITNHLSCVLLPKILSKFHKAYPNIQVDIMEASSSVLDEELALGRIDFAIMHLMHNEKLGRHKIIPLLREPFIVLSSIDNSLSKYASEQANYPYPLLDIKILKNENMIMLSEGMRIRQICDCVLSNAGIRNPHITLTTQNYRAAYSLAMHGLGISILPLSYINDERTMDISYYSIPDKYKAFWTLCVAYPDNSFLSRADEVFLDIIKEELL